MLRKQGWNREQPMVALMPDFTQLPRTTSARPSLHFVLPPVSAVLPLEFVLRDEDNNVVYKETLETPLDGGLMSIQLPAQTLQTDQTYRWALSVILNEQHRSLDVFVIGNLRYVVADDAVVRDFDQLDLDSALTEEALDIQEGLVLVDGYQSAGLWNNAVPLAVQLHQLYPDSAAVSQYWTELLQTLKLDSVVEVTSDSSLFLTR